MSRRDKLKKVRHKWFDSLTPEMPVGLAAREVSEARVDVVPYYLKSLETLKWEDAEDIHQLRVSTRRLGAALTAFRPWLETKGRRRACRSAKRIRRGAGALRDLDVQLSILSGCRHFVGTSGHHAIDGICEVLENRRKPVQKKLRRVLKKWSARLKESIQRLLFHLSKDPVSVLFKSAGHRSLTLRSRQFNRAGEKDVAQFDNLHQLRIAGKRLRYAMEIFASCYGADFRNRSYKQVESIQQQLGEINDLWNLHETINHLNETATDSSLSVQPLLADLEGKLHERRQEFVVGWRNWQLDDFRERLENLLSHPRIQHDGS